MDGYVSALCREITSCKPQDKSVDTVYIGGGTPSCLSSGALSRIFDAVRSSFTVDNNAEITVEVNPESCDSEFVSEALACGVNRISIGLQSACDAALKKIGRLHDVNGFIKAVELVRSLGIDNVSSDLILGLPKQNENDVDNALQLVSRYCDHVSVYALTVEEGTDLFRRGYKPEDDFVADLYDRACVSLDSLGFKRYEVSNFARNGRISRHNSKYWRLVPYYGFGAGAHGYDGDRIRYRHTESVPEYVQDQSVIEERLSDKDIYNEYIMLALRTEKGIDRKDFCARFGEKSDFGFKSAADRFIKQGVLLFDGGYIRIPPDKMFVMNSVIEELMID